MGYSGKNLPGRPAERQPGLPPRRTGGAALLKQDGWFAALKHLTWLTQLGLSLAVPPLLSLLAAGWLAQKFSLGPWVWVLAILLGLGAAGCTLAEFARMFLRRTGSRSNKDGEEETGG